MNNNDVGPAENTSKPPFYGPFLDYVKQHVEVEADFEALLMDNCKLVHFPKGYRLLEKDELCKYSHFMLTGEAVSYFVDYNGKQTTWFFHFNTSDSTIKNLFAVDYKSFLTGEPATLSLETLSPVSALRFSVENVLTLSKASLSFERFLARLTEQSFILIYDRINTLLMLSALERYKKFLETEPHLLNLFSNYWIAFYLNVEPQSLSRLRRQLAFGK